jgi:hypothetical protein
MQIFTFLWVKQVNVCLNLYKNTKIFMIQNKCLFYIIGGAVFQWKTDKPYQTPLSTVRLIMKYIFIVNYIRDKC